MLVGETSGTERYGTKLVIDGMPTLLKKAGTESERVAVRTRHGETTSCWSMPGAPLQAQRRPRIEPSAKKK